jgi:transcriptional regulator with XRE-family HTH domain
MTNEEAKLLFGAEVRRRRESLGMTLEVLAARAGLTPNYVGTIEAGKRDPSVSTIVGLAKGLGISPAELFSSRLGYSPASDEAGRLFDLVVPNVQEAVMTILRAVAKPRRQRGPRKPRKPR